MVSRHKIVHRLKMRKNSDLYTQKQCRRIILHSYFCGVLGVYQKVRNGVKVGKPPASKLGIITGKCPVVERWGDIPRISPVSRRDGRYLSNLFV